MIAIYNELDAYPAQWLRNLIAAGHVAPGVVDERSIVDLAPDDVAGPGQRHFFAGIGVWSYALRLAGVPDDVPIWTGSCPCQPFSGAGLKLGFADERHVWPAWFRLIAECRPAIVFGEQVASADGLAWLDAVRADMEGAGYSFGAADLPAACVGGPHKRQRLFFVAHADGVPGRLLVPQRESHGADAKARRRREGVRGMADSTGERQPWAAAAGEARSWRPWGDAERSHAGMEWVRGADGLARPIEPGLAPLAHGVADRVGRLRAYGNAIVPQVAATFIRAALEVIA